MTSLYTSSGKLLTRGGALATSADCCCCEPCCLDLCCPGDYIDLTIANLLDSPVLEVGPMSDDCSTFCTVGFESFVYWREQWLMSNVNGTYRCFWITPCGGTYVWKTNTCLDGPKIWTRRDDKCVYPPIIVGLGERYLTEITVTLGCCQNSGCLAYTGTRGFILSNIQFKFKGRTKFDADDWSACGTNTALNVPFCLTSHSNRIDPTVAATTCGATMSAVGKQVHWNSTAGAVCFDNDLANFATCTGTLPDWNASGVLGGAP